MIQENSQIPIVKQCQLLDLHRSTYYYEPIGESEKNIDLMRRIDELYTDNPSWGSRKMRDRLRLEGHIVNRKRIQRLMRIMAIEAIYPKKDTSKPKAKAGVHPYLLRGFDISHSNLVWCADITYIRLKHGFVYLFAIMDWYSRKILSWELSTTMDRQFCISTLERALRIYGTPAIFNTDQGSQFTSPAFTDVLEEEKILISMDGKGRASDNIMIERFWRTLKYEEVYLKDYKDVNECRKELDLFIQKYNSFRPHSTQAGQVPDTIYYGGLTSLLMDGQVKIQKKVS